MSTRKTPVLIVAHHLDRGGVEEVIRLYARYLDREKYSVIVACAYGGHAASVIGTMPEVRLVNLSTGIKFTRFLAFWRLARQVQPGIVHNHFSWYGLFIGFLVGAKRVETVHNVYDWFGGFKRLAYALSCLFANRILTVSDFVGRGTMRVFPILRLKGYTVVHNGIEVERFDIAGRRASLRAGVGEEEVLVGFLGRFEPQKGLEHLLDAMAGVVDEYPNTTVFLAGGGTLEPVLRNRVLELSLRNARFLGFQNDVPGFLGMLDIFVLPSLFEGLPLTLLEAMASGLPVVASRVGGVPEALEDGVSGFLVDPGDPMQLADRLRRLIRDPSLRERMGVRGRERVGREFSVQAMIRRTEAIYDDLLGA